MTKKFKYVAATYKHHKKTLESSVTLSKTKDGCVVFRAFSNLDYMENSDDRWSHYFNSKQEAINFLNQLLEGVETL